MKSPERKAYLHVGTQKTGTTSIQSFVTMNEPALAESGIFVPRTGRPTRWQSMNVGHHNLAWELNGSSIFEPKEGTFEEALREIALVDAPKVLITSEDFFWLHSQPDVLERIRDSLRAIGYSTTVIVYLRSQIEMIDVLSAHNASAAGILFDYDEVLENVLSRGTWSSKAATIEYILEYGRPIDVLASVFGAERILVRPYRSERPAFELLDEFLDVIGGCDIPRRLLLRPGVRNQSATFIRVLQALHRSVMQRRADAVDPEQIIQAHLGAADRSLLDRKFGAMTQAEHGKVLERFAADNRYLHSRYGAGPPLLEERDLPQRSSPDVAAAEAQRITLRAATAAWNIGSASAS